MQVKLSNLVADIVEQKTRRKRNLVYLDQNIYSGFANGRPAHFTALLESIEPLAKAGKIACPEFLQRRSESIETDELWMKINNHIKTLSFGIGAHSWHQMIARELHAASMKVDLVLGIENTSPHPLITWRTYFDSDPDKECDDRYINFFGTDMRLQVQSEISSHERVLKERERNRWSQIKEARELDRTKIISGTKDDFLHYQVDQLWRASLGPVAFGMQLSSLFNSVRKKLTDQDRLDLFGMVFYIPQFWILASLEYALLRNEDRRLKESDYMDCQCMSAALASCDFAITDSEMANFVRQTKLDTQFSCQVFPSSIKGVEKFLEAVCCIE